MAPHLSSISGTMVSKTWGLKELLLHTHTVIHQRLSKSLTASTIPFLDIKEVGANRLLISYQSERKMCHFAKGLLQGLSHLYQEPILIEKKSCMHKGDVIPSIKNKIHHLSYSNGRFPSNHFSLIFKDIRFKMIVGNHLIILA
ncbi:MAG: heme NO-binding domain-containing protein [Parachlamydia sp.]|jgi:hypothetical protein|nr:heme NO-binding domain-containing protein [Parachlamydia sp.]